MTQCTSHNAVIITTGVGGRVGQFDIRAYCVSLCLISYMIFNVSLISERTTASYFISPAFHSARVLKNFTVKRSVTYDSSCYLQHLWLFLVSNPNSGQGQLHCKSLLAESSKVSDLPYCVLQPRNLCNSDNFLFFHFLHNLC